MSTREIRQQMAWFLLFGVAFGVFLILVFGKRVKAQDDGEYFPVAHWCRLLEPYSEAWFALNCHRMEDGGGEDMLASVTVIDYEDGRRTLIIKTKPVKKDGK